jgi:sulfoquinovosyltransferase
MRNRLTNGMPDTPLIVHVGRLGVEKNLDFLKRVMDRIPEAYLAFIGDGPYRADLEQMFQGMNVTFTGMLQGEELSQAYASGDVFITPSESETLGFVVLEAMACGVSVVAARAGGIPDIVNQDGETGFLYTPGDLDDCVKKLRALLESSELREKGGSAGKVDYPVLSILKNTPKCLSFMCSLLNSEFDQQGIMCLSVECGTTTKTGRCFW